MSVDIVKFIPTAFEQAGAALSKYRHNTYTKKPEEAKKVLDDEQATATGIFMATHQLLGDAFLAWEPESIWLELQDKGIDLSLENRDKLQAAITIIVHGSFYWDALVFENIVMAFNSIPSAPDIIQEASPGMITWAVLEMELFAKFAGKTGEYDYEPTRYTALSLHRDGLAVAPELLAFAQEELDKLNDKNAIDLKTAVIDRWNKLDKTKLETLDLREDPVDVQIGRLVAIHLYMAERVRKLMEDIDRL